MVTPAPKGKGRSGSADDMVIEPNFGFHGASRPTDQRSFDTTGIDRQREQTKRVSQSFARQVMRRVMRNRAARLARRAASRGLSRAFGGAGKSLAKTAGRANVYGFAGLVIARLATGRSIENLEYLANPWNHAHRARAAKKIREQMMGDELVARAVGIRASRGQVAGDVEEAYEALVGIEERIETGIFNVTSDIEFQSNGPLDLFILANEDVLRAAWDASGAPGVVAELIKKTRELRGLGVGGR